MVFDAVIDDQTSYFRTGLMWREYSAEDFKNKIAYFRIAGSDALATETES